MMAPLAQLVGAKPGYFQDPNCFAGIAVLFSKARTRISMSHATNATGIFTTVRPPPEFMKKL
jgi:hypothetical protein